MIYTIFGITILILYLYSLWRCYIYKKLEGLEELKGPSTWPFVGCILAYLPPSRVITINNAHFKKYGKTYKAALPFAAGICTMDPEFIEFILTTNSTTDKSIVYTVTKEWLGDGLFISKFARWRSIKKILAPAFHNNVVKAGLHVFNRNSDILVEQMTKVVNKNGADIDISHYMSLATMDNIVEIGLGAGINTQLNQSSDFVWATEFMTHQICAHVLNPITYIHAIYIFTKDYWRERKALRMIKEFTMKLIQTERDTLRKSESISDDLVDTNDDILGVRKKASGMIQLMLHATLDGQPLSDEYMAKEVSGYLFAGYDSVSAALSFTLLCISKYPHIQAKIIDEQRRIFGGDPGREATMDDFHQMTYLEMVIKEGLRIYTVVSYIGRAASEDVHFKNLHICKGTELIVAIGEVHHDPEIYPNPDEFIPERFLPEEQAKRHPFAFLPFSGGHRNCMGQRFAMIELKATISKVCRHFELATVDPPHICKILIGIVIQSENGVIINLKRRQW